MNPLATVDRGPIPVTCPGTTPIALPVGASRTCTSTITVTQADIDEGRITDFATATAASATQAVVQAASGAVPVDALISPDFTFSKTFSPGTYTAVGQTITYTFTVVNTGNVTLTNLSLLDAYQGGSPFAVPCTPNSVGVGQTRTCTLTYTVVQEDINRGFIRNIAQACATPSPIPASQPPCTGSDWDVVSEATATIAYNTTTTTTPTTQPGGGGNTRDGLTFDKSTAATSFSTAGQIITYSFSVKNTSTTAFGTTTISDPMLPGLACSWASIAVNETKNCAGPYTVTAADVVTGTIVNTATATVSGGPSVTDSVTINKTGTTSAVLDLKKTADKNTYSAVGDVITYTYDITNKGTTALSVTVTDDKLGSICVCDIGVGLGAQRTRTYTVTAEDLNRSGITNVATATAGSNSVTATLTVRSAPRRSMRLTKTASPTTYKAAGDVITYTYKVLNTGNATLNTVAVTDDKLGPIVDCDVATLSAGAEKTCTKAHTVTDAEVTAGKITNKAVATAASSVTSEDTVTVTLEGSPGLNLVKTASTATFTAVGQVITYSYDVTNTGTVAAANLTVTDDKLGAIADCSAATLQAKATKTCTKTYAITQADLDGSGITNIATATAGALKDIDKVTIVPDRRPSVSLAKTADETTYSAVGDKIIYTVTVTNDGNVTLKNLSVTDELVRGDSCPIDSIAPTQAKTCMFEITITQAMLDAGFVRNVAHVAGSGVSGSATLRIPAEQTRKLAIDKTADVTTATAGSSVTFGFAVANTGNVTLEGVRVTDSKLGDICTIPRLAPGATTNCSKPYVVSAADATAGKVDGTATAAAGENKATDPLSLTVTTTIDKPQPSPTRPLPFTGANTTTTLVWGLALTALGVTLLAGDRMSRRRLVN